MKNINKNTKTNTASTFLDRATKSATKETARAELRRVAQVYAAEVPAPRHTTIVATKLTKSSATKPSVKTTKAAVPAGRRIVAAKTVTKPTTKPAVKTTPKRSRHTPTQNKQ